MNRRKRHAIKVLLYLMQRGCISPNSQRYAFPEDLYKEYENRKK